MKYNSDYFTKKVEDTPEEMFGTETYLDNSGKMCILGMCGQRPGKHTDESLALLDLFWKINMYPSGVNDGLYKRYKQTTAKQRLLAALNDVKEKEQQEANVKSVEEIVKEDTVLSINN